MSLDFSRWAILSPKTATGFGRMAEDAKHVLGIRCHLISDTYHLQNEPLGQDIALPASLSKDELRKLLQNLPGLEAILTFERLTWHAGLPAVCKDLDIPLICVVMWEWFNGKDPIWKTARALICPSDFTAGIVASYGYKNYVSLPWAVDLAKLPHRQIQGSAKHFGHNAGVIDAQDRKGTSDVLSAFSKLKDPEATLTVRYIDSALPLKTLDPRIRLIQGALEKPADLFETIDVAIQPSKMEGIGFMVLEAICSGLPTITLDYPPMNTYGQTAGLLVEKTLFKRRALSTHFCEHAHLYLPKPKDLLEKIKGCTDNDLSFISSENRRWAESYFEPERLKKLWHAKLNPYF